MSNKFRKEYRELDAGESHQVAAIKEAAELLDDVFEQMTESREKSLAMTKLEESVMWAVKGITG